MFILVIFTTHIISDIIQLNRVFTIFKALNKENIFGTAAGTPEKEGQWEL
jgi:hypothetical protein